MTQKQQHTEPQRDNQYCSDPVGGRPDIGGPCSAVADPRGFSDYSLEIRRCIEALARAQDERPTDIEDFHPVVQYLASELYPSVVRIAEMVEEIEALEAAKVLLTAAAQEVITAGCEYLNALAEEGLL